MQRGHDAYVRSPQSDWTDGRAGFAPSFPAESSPAGCRAEVVPPLRELLAGGGDSIVLLRKGDADHRSVGERVVVHLFLGQVYQTPSFRRLTTQSSGLKGNKECVRYELSLSSLRSS